MIRLMERSVQGINLLNKNNACSVVKKLPEQPLLEGTTVTPQVSEPGSPNQTQPLGQKPFPIECFFEIHAVTFEDIVGCDRAKQLLEENVVFQLKLPEVVRSKVLQGLFS